MEHVTLRFRLVQATDFVICVVLIFVFIDKKNNIFVLNEETCFQALLFKFLHFVFQKMICQSLYVMD